MLEVLCLIPIEGTTVGWFHEHQRTGPDVDNEAKRVAMAMAMTSHPELSNVRPKQKPQVEMEEFEGLLDLEEDGFQVRRRELSPLSAEEAFVVEAVLSDVQCDRLQTHVERMEMSFWNPEDPSTSFRNAVTVEVRSHTLARAIWARVQPLVPRVLTLTPDSPLWERGMDGEWEAIGIQEGLLFAKYFSGGHFSPHTDGCTVLDFDHRSLYSVILYLNDCQHGGATRILQDQSLEEVLVNDSTSVGDEKHRARGAHDQEFVQDEEGRYRWPEGCVVAKSDARRGDALIFRQDLPHEGEPVGEGCTKFIIRTDVMYRRVHPVLVEERDKTAYRLFKEAEILELEGHADEAAQLFRKCLKLSPSLAKIYGM